jgi:hypothetical protein
LTNGNTVLETTAARLRLVTLGRIYEEFCRLAWEENPETPLEYLAEFLEIDPVALGILASTGSTDDITDAIDEFGLRVAALQAATDSQRKVIFQCLEAAYGGPVKLFSRLWHTRADAAEADDDLPEFEPVPGNCSALEYVQNGFLLG